MTLTDANFTRIGPLQPGTYVLESTERLSEAAMDGIRDRWAEAAPDGCKLIVMPAGLHLARHLDTTEEREP